MDVELLVEVHAVRLHGAARQEQLLLDVRRIAPCAMSRAISVSRGESWYVCATERHFALKGVLCLNGTICTSAFASASVNTTA